MRERFSRVGAEFATGGALHRRGESFWPAERAATCRAFHRRMNLLDFRGRHFSVIPLIPHWVFRHRGIFANVPLVFALFMTRGEVRNNALAWSMGLGLLLLGIMVRVWAQQHIHHRLVKTLEFTHTGPYRIVRNPLYIGNTLLILGAVAFSKLLWLLPPALIWCGIFYSIIVRYEENGLAKHFGAPYIEYKSRVPRWVPRFADLRQFHFANEYLGRAVFAELHCFLILIPFVLKDLLLSSGHSL